MDHIIQRLQNIPPFNIYQINPDGSCNPWYEVIGKDVVAELLISDFNIKEQVQSVSAIIGHWGRLRSQAKRVWDIKAREYRIWKATKYLEFRQDEEKHTEKEIDALIRTSVGYNQMYTEVERAEEAYESTSIIVQAWQAKKAMMKDLLYRHNTEDGSELVL